MRNCLQNRFSFIQGPPGRCLKRTKLTFRVHIEIYPGTGKTTTIVALTAILAALFRDFGQEDAMQYVVLITASSNKAVNTIIGKVYFFAT